MKPFRKNLPPGLRGAIFYGAYWGMIGMFDPYFSLFFLDAGLDAERIGWLAGVLPLCTLVIAPLVTRLADRISRRVFMLMLALFGLGAALTIPAWPIFRAEFGLVLAFVALYAVFRSPVVALADSLIASMAAHHDLNFGGMRLWGSILFTAAAIGLGALWQGAGFRVMFLASGVVALLVVIAAASLLDEAPPASSAAPITAAADVAAAARGKLPIDPGILFLLSATFLVIAGFFMSNTFSPVYMMQLGGSESMVGWMTGLSALAEAPGMLFGSRIARKFGPTSTLIAAYAGIAAGMFGTGIAATPAQLIFFAFLRGLGLGLLLVSTVMTINTRAPRAFTSTYQGILNAACWGLAPLLGGPISGWIFQNLGGSALFFTAGGLALAGILLLLPTYRTWRANPAS